MAKGRKTGGRKPGTRNKTTTMQRAFVQDVLDGQQNKLVRELSKLTGKEYVQSVLQLMEFVIPKMQRQQPELPERNYPEPVAPIVRIFMAPDEDGK